MGSVFSGLWIITLAIPLQFAVRLPGWPFLAWGLGIAGLALLAREEAHRRKALAALPVLLGAVILTLLGQSLTVGRENVFLFTVGVEGGLPKPVGHLGFVAVSIGAAFFLASGPWARTARMARAALVLGFLTAALSSRSDRGWVVIGELAFSSSILVFAVWIAQGLLLAGLGAAIWQTRAEPPQRPQVGRGVAFLFGR